MSDRDAVHSDSAQRASAPAQEHEAPAAHQALQGRTQQTETHHADSSASQPAHPGPTPGADDSPGAGNEDASTPGNDHAVARNTTTGNGSDRPHMQLEARPGVSGGPAPHVAGAAPGTSPSDSLVLQPSPAASVGLSGQNAIVPTQLTTTIPLNAALAGHLPDAPPAAPPRPHTEQRSTDTPAPGHPTHHDTAGHADARSSTNAGAAPAHEEDYHVTETSDSMTFQFATDAHGTASAGSGLQRDVSHAEAGATGNSGDKDHKASVVDLQPGSVASRATADAAQRSLQDRGVQSMLWDRLIDTVADAATPGSAWDRVTSALTRAPDQVAATFGLTTPTQEVHELRQTAQTARGVVQAAAAEVHRLGAQQTSTSGSVAYHLVSSYAGMVASAMRQFAYDETPGINTNPIGPNSISAQAMHTAGVPMVLGVPARLLVDLPVLGTLANESINRMAAQQADFARGTQEHGGGGALSAVLNARDAVDRQLNPLRQVEEHGRPFVAAILHGDPNGAADHALPFGVAVFSAIVAGHQMVGMATGVNAPTVAGTPPPVTETPTLTGTPPPVTETPTVTGTPPPVTGTSPAAFETTTHETALPDDERPTTRMGQPLRAAGPQVVPATRSGSTDPASTAVVDRSAEPTADVATQAPTQGPALPRETVAQVVDDQLARTPDVAGRVHGVLAAAGDVQYMSEGEVRAHVEALSNAAARRSVDVIYDAEETNRWMAENSARSVLAASHGVKLPNLPRLALHGAGEHEVQWRLAGGGDDPPPPAFHTSDNVMHVLLRDFTAPSTSGPPVVGTPFTPAQSGRLTDPSPAPTFDSPAGSSVSGPARVVPPDPRVAPADFGRANTVEVGNERPTLVPGEVTPEQIARAGRAIAVLRVAGRPAGAIEAADIVVRTQAMGDIAGSYDSDEMARQANGNPRAIRDCYDGVQFRMEWTMAGGSGAHRPRAFQTTNGVTFIDRSDYRGE